MIQMESILPPDPLWLSIVKVVIVFALLLIWTIFNVWFERRVLGKMQNRKGPIMNGPLGLGQAMGDGVKLLVKEDFRPARTDAVLFNLAPVLIAVAAFAAWAVIPFGGQVSIGGRLTALQISDLPVATLLILALASIGVYGVVLAGWSSNGTYSLFGSMRSCAQMISYEVAMGLSLVAVFMYAGSMSTSEIVEAQGATISFFGLFGTNLPGWYGLLLLPSFIVYFISMFGETNRLPFDFAECESEIVSGHITDYSGFRYAMYFLAEYINMATTSAVATTLFLGGFHAPWPLNGTMFDQGWWTLIWFFLKVQLLIFVYAWVRAALPRLRYDQFMNLGWKVLVPGSLVWIMLIGIMRGGMTGGWLTSPGFLVTVAVVFLVLLGGSFLLERRELAEEPPGIDLAEPFDPFAGGYPVPPMPGQQLPELAGVVASTVATSTTSDGDDA